MTSGAWPKPDRSGSSEPLRLIDMGVLMAQTYEVVRQHLGDKNYFPGDTREAEPADVAHLVPHILQPKVKKEPKPKNKAEPSVDNKEV